MLNLRVFAVCASLPFALSAFAGAPCGVYVAPQGDDANSGLEPGSPVRTIGAGIVLAAQQGISCVFVQAGDYPEIIHILSGITVDGGYDAKWIRGSHLSPAHQTRIFGAFEIGLDRFVTVIVRDIGPQTGTLPGTVSNLHIIGPDAGGKSSSGDGMNSYGLWVDNSTLRVVDVNIVGGRGAGGAGGAPGASPEGQAPAGLTGFPAVNTGCNPNNSNIVRGATNSGISSTRGGNSGAGGARDDSCGGIGGAFPQTVQAQPEPTRRSGKGAWASAALAPPLAWKDRRALQVCPAPTALSAPRPSRQCWLKTATSGPFQTATAASASTAMEAVVAAGLEAAATTAARAAARAAPAACAHPSSGKAGAAAAPASASSRAIPS